MTKYIKDYMAYLSEQLNNNSINISKIEQEFLTKIAFFQHERLIHLIVTMIVIIAMFFSILLIFITKLPATAFLSLILLILTAFYLKHYYFLENSIQKMYKIYDEILLKKEEKINNENN